jgi:hypothetical protein
MPITIGFFSWERINNFPFISYGKNSFGIRPVWYKPKDLERIKDVCRGTTVLHKPRSEFSDNMYSIRTYFVFLTLQEYKTVYNTHFSLLVPKMIESVYFAFLTEKLTFVN